MLGTNQITAKLLWIQTASQLQGYFFGAGAGIVQSAAEPAGDVNGNDAAVLLADFFIHRREAPGGGRGGGWDGPGCACEGPQPTSAGPKSREKNGQPCFMRFFKCAS